MKKLSLIAVTLLVGAVSSWAAGPQVGSIVFGPVPITFKGTLSDKTKVTDATLTTIAGGGALQWAEVAITAGSLSGQVFDVIGTGIGTVNVGSTNVATNDVVGTVIYASGDTVDLSKSGSKSLKLIGTYHEDGTVYSTNLVLSSILTNLQAATSGISNSTLLVTATVSGSTKSTNVSAKVIGIWYSGKTSVSGSVKAAKK